mmetsp:Transcript_72125/g.220829  ORF Transcript_72125/g.220829 Transcript_72125/m.220829 type:complete len:486 (-) Transcript_72125:962-2419(-)
MHVRSPLAARRGEVENRAAGQGGRLVPGAHEVRAAGRGRAGTRFAHAVGAPRRRGGREVEGEGGLHGAAKGRHPPDGEGHAQAARAADAEGHDGRARCGGRREEGGQEGSRGSAPAHGPGGRRHARDPGHGGRHRHQHLGQREHGEGSRGAPWHVQHDLHEHRRLVFVRPHLPDRVAGDARAGSRGEDEGCADRGRVGESDRGPGALGALRERVDAHAEGVPDAPDRGHPARGGQELWFPGRGLAGAVRRRPHAVLVGQVAECGDQRRRVRGRTPRCRLGPRCSAAGASGLALGLHLPHRAAADREWRHAGDKGGRSAAHTIARPPRHVGVLAAHAPVPPDRLGRLAGGIRGDHQASRRGGQGSRRGVRWHVPAFVVAPDAAGALLRLRGRAGLRHGAVLFLVREAGRRSEVRAGFPVIRGVVRPAAPLVVVVDLHRPFGQVVGASPHCVLAVEGAVAERPESQRGDLAAALAGGADAEGLWAQG